MFRLKLPALIVLASTGCSLIVDSKLNKKSGDGGEELPPTRPVGEQGDQQPFVIGERIRSPLDPQGLATQAMIGSKLETAVPCPGGAVPNRRLFACSVSPYTPGGPNKFFLVDASLKELASFDIAVRRLLVQGSVGQRALRLFDADALAQPIGGIPLPGAVAAAHPLVLSPSGRYLVVVTDAGPLLVDLVRRVHAGLPKECAAAPPAFEPDAQLLVIKLLPDSPLPFSRPEATLWCGRSKLLTVPLPERIEAQPLTAVDANLPLAALKRYSWLSNPDGSRWLVGLTEEPRAFAVVMAPGATAPVFFASDQIQGASYAVGASVEKPIVGLSPQGAVVVLWQNGGYHLSAYRPAEPPKLGRISDAQFPGSAKIANVEQLVPVPGTNLIGLDGSIVAAPAGLPYARVKIPLVQPQVTVEVANELSLESGQLTTQPVPIFAGLFYQKRLLVQQLTKTAIFQDPRTVIFSSPPLGPPVAQHPLQQRLYTVEQNKLLTYEYAPSQLKPPTGANVEGIALPAYLIVQP